MSFFSDISGATTKSATTKSVIHSAIPHEEKTEEMLVEAPTYPPASLFNNQVGDFWRYIVNMCPTGDAGSAEIWNSIKWMMVLSATKDITNFDTVTITGKYSYDESWTEAFATAKNAEVWKQHTVDMIHSNCGYFYKIKIVSGMKKTSVAKNEASITVNILYPY